MSCTCLTYRYYHCQAVHVHTDFGPAWQNFKACRPTSSAGGRDTPYFKKSLTNFFFFVSNTIFCSENFPVPSGQTYRVPACPSGPSTPADNSGIERKWFAQKIDVWSYVTHQIDSLQCCLREKQNCVALSFWQPAFAMHRSAD